MTRRVLFLAYHFPPQVGIASERAAAMARWLPKNGWDVRVVTVQDGVYPKREEDASWADTSDVIRTPAVELSRILRTLAVGSSERVHAEPLRLGRTGNRLRGLARDLLYVPDSRVGWIPYARRALRLHLSERPSGALVYSTAVPYSAHLAAWSALGPDTLWVAEFRDPWSEAHRDVQSGSATRRALNARMHQGILSRADRIIVTTESGARELTRKREVPREKIRVVANGYEPGPLGTPPHRAQACRLVYAGSVSPGERVAPLLTALSRVRRRHGDRVRLRVVGPLDPWRQAAGAAGLQAGLELPGTTSPDVARQEMANASVNVLLKWHPAYRNIVAGKAFEYLGVRRPILAGLPADTEMGRLLERTGEVTFVVADDPNAWETALETVLREHEEGSLQGPRAGTPALADLTREAQARRLARVFDELDEDR